MTLLPPHRGENPLAESWATLAVGAPMIIGYATLCARSLMNDPAGASPPLGESAKVLLFLAREHGVFELKVVKDAFASADRFLTVHIETSPEVWLACRISGDARTNADFLEGFRQLCGAGCIAHHLNAEFSLSSTGFRQAETIEEASIADLLERIRLSDLENQV